MDDTRSTSRSLLDASCRRDLLLFAGGALTALVSVSVGVALHFMTLRSVTAPTTANAVAAAPTAQSLPAPTELPDVKVEDTLAGMRVFTQMGKPDAPVKIVIFADPQCPFCKQSALGTEVQLIQDYVQTGAASLTYRHMAFLGPESTRIASAMECAGQQGGFWAFHNVVFQKQASENSGQVTDATLNAWAAEAKLDTVALSSCLTENKGVQAVTDDLALARRLGVTGTPTLFINGRRMVGALPYDALKATVDAALAAAKR
jgi:protein-disulfide isomerase